MRIIPLFIFLLLCASCRYEQEDEPDNYPKDFNISSPSGRPWDSLEYYIPTTIRIDSQVVKLEIPKLKLEYFSSGLYYAHEPILYNYYLGHDIYRFSLLRAFYAPLYFILHRDGDKIWLVTKGLDRRPNTVLPPSLLVKHGNIQHWEDATHDEYGDTIIINAKGSYIRRANVLYNGYVELTRQDWIDFEALLTECGFGNLPPYAEKDEFQVDGEIWLIESHRRTTYRFVCQHSPRGAFANVGKFLIQRSGVEQKPIFKQEQ